MGIRWKETNGLSLFIVFWSLRVRSSDHPFRAGFDRLGELKSDQISAISGVSLFQAVEMVS